MDNYKIYGLYEPDNITIRYIGQTKNKLEYRFNAHIKDKSDTHKVYWIQSLLKNNHPTRKPTQEFKFLPHRTVCLESNKTNKISSLRMLYMKWKTVKVIENKIAEVKRNDWLNYL